MKKENKDQISEAEKLNEEAFALLSPMAKVDHILNGVLAVLENERKNK